VLGEPVTFPDKKIDFLKRFSTSLQEVIGAFSGKQDLASLLSRKSWDIFAFSREKIDFFILQFKGIPLSSNSHFFLNSP
jgi:hypothetical protein